MHPKPEDRLIVALDVSSAAAAQKVVTALGDSVHIYKVGMQLYTAEGPKIVRDLVSSGRQVFLDLKYHDIPNTVASAVREAAGLGVSMLTVHASGGEKMLRAAAEATRVTAGVHARQTPVQILAVTVLTSMDESNLHQTGVSGPLLDQVLRLASTALDAGCAGVVSSAREVQALRAKLGQDFLIVNPGVRPAGTDHGDQARVVTPVEAIQAGATHIVVGRPITAAKDPAAAARAIQQEICVAADEASPVHDVGTLKIFSSSETPATSARSLTALRIAVGCIFLIFSQYKVFGVQFTREGGFQHWINLFLQGGAYPFMVPILRNFVLPHATPIAFLVAYSELAIGLAMASGILVRAASVCGVIYMLTLLFSSNYPGANAPMWQYFGASLDHSVLALCFAAFTLTNPEELWSIHSLRRRSLSRERAKH